jgi:hypothetical protein
MDPSVGNRLRLLFNHPWFASLQKLSSLNPGRIQFINSRRTRSTMAAKKTAPFGTWESPISADLLTLKAKSHSISFLDLTLWNSQTIRIEDILVDSVTSKVYHVESRPDERGRNVVVESDTGKDTFGSDFNAR